MTTKELTGKVAIVTGAGRNIGRAIALALADGGASVVVNARSNRAEAEAVAREIEAAGGKALVHIGDIADATAVPAKAGIIGFTRALAHDLADDAITVNCVVPGLIGTPRPKHTPEPAHHLIHHTITGERGRPEDVAAAVRFLCSPGARYINGQAIHANGGG